MKHIEFYKACMETGYLPLSLPLTGGLCDCAEENLINADLLDDLSPTEENRIELRKEGCPTGYWGYNVYNWHLNPSIELTHKFTPLRQTVVLFMAAMSGEL